MNKTFRLQKRDKEILDFLENQKFCSFFHIRNNFFISNNSCFVRLSKLQRMGFLQSFRFQELLSLCEKSSEHSYLKKLGIRSRSRVYTASKNPKLYSTQFLAHQFILSEAVFLFQKKFKNKRFIFPTDLQKMKSCAFSRKNEPKPDFSIECDLFKLAVEIEATQKSNKRYSQKFSDYLNSIYTHILYIYITDKIKRVLQNKMQMDSRIGLCHYSSPFEVETFRWGSLELKDWIQKINKRRKYYE